MRCYSFAVWFDVQTDGKVGYHEAQVIEMDFNSAVKRVKFHFWRLSNASDEWVEVGSPRIAPHVSISTIAAVLHNRETYPIICISFTLSTHTRQGQSTDMEFQRRIGRRTKKRAAKPKRQQ